MPVFAIVKFRRTVGFTLLEVLVGIFLTGLILTVLLRVAGATYRIGHEEIQRGALESSTLMAAKKLEQDLMNSAPAGLSLVGGHSLLVQPVDSVLPSGRIVFASRFEYWRLAQTTVEGRTQQCLVRSEVTTRPDGDPFDGSATRWTAAQVAGLGGGAGERPSLTLAGVTKFEVTNPQDETRTLIGPLVAFAIEMELPIAATRRNLRLQRTVLLRTPGGG